MIKIIKKNQAGGTAILLILLIVSSFLVVTLTMSDLVVNGFRMDRTQLESIKAYFAAESGIERVLFEARKHCYDFSICANNGDYIELEPSCGSDDCCGADCCEAAFVSYSLSNGAEYSVTYSFDAPTTTLSSLGVFSDVQRKVEVY